MELILFGLLGLFLAAVAGMLLLSLLFWLISEACAVGNAVEKDIRELCRRKD